MINKKNLLAGTLVGILVLIFLMSSFNKKTVQKATIPTPIPTPTTIPLPPTAYQNTSIISFAPSDGSSNVSLFATISATFSRPLTTPEEQHVLLSLSPNVTGTISWSEDNTTISFTPSRLGTTTSYTTTILFGSTKSLWSFTTSSEETLSQEDKNTLQLQSDDQFGSWQNELYTNYPWYDSLPFQTDDYYTYFDIDTKQFISDIYTDPNNSSQITATKQEIIARLQSLGIDTSKYQFVWTLN